MEDRIIIDAEFVDELEQHPEWIRIVRKSAIAFLAIANDFPSDYINLLKKYADASARAVDNDPRIKAIRAKHVARHGVAVEQETHEQAKQLAFVQTIMGATIYMMTARITEISPLAFMAANEVQTEMGQFLHRFRQEKQKGNVN